MKKRLSLLVALVMVLTMFATNAFAASSLSLAADKTVLEKGDSLLVTVYAPDANLTSMEFALTYDNTVFDCDDENTYSEDIKISNKVKWGAGTLEINDSTGRIGYAGASSEPIPVTSKGVLFYAAFTVKDTATGGDYSFKMVNFEANEGTAAADLTVKVAGPVSVDKIEGMPTSSSENRVQVEYADGGFDIVKLVPALSNYAGQYTITYYAENSDEPLSAAPTELGNYRAVITANGSQLTGEFVVYFTINKGTQTLSFAKSELVVAYGDTVNNPLTGHKFGTVQYTSSDPAVATVNESTGAVTLLKAGEVTVTATVVGDGVKYDTVSANYKLTINKAKLTITAKDFEALLKTEIPTLGSDHYTVKGLVNGHTAADVLNVTLTYKQDPDMTVEGEYSFTVTADVKDAYKDRYEINQVNSDLEGVMSVVKKTNRPPQSGKPGSVSNFVDVDARAYYYDAVEWAVANGITEGKTYFKFAPNEACTRAQMVTFLWRAAGCPTPSGSYSKFVDVNMNKYYADAVLWAVENGITEGKTATTFAPNQACTRAQMATFLYRFAKGSANGNASGFSDVSSSKYYAPAVAWAVKNGITNGTTANTFSPNNVCTRAQMVTFLYRYFEA